MTVDLGIKIIVTEFPPDTEDAVCEAFESDDNMAVSATAITVPANSDGRVSIEFYCNATIDEETARARLTAAIGADLAAAVEMTIEEIENRDWVAESQAGLTPIEAGRFFVHGAHDRHLRPLNAHTIELEAGQAFGTGHHGTTKGCLLALDAELKRHTPRRVLDVGCGSGILAIAAAMAIKSVVVASDIDPIAIKVAQENARKNNVQGFVRTSVAAGTGHRSIQEMAPYNIVFANILARPLIALAPDIRSVLAKGGRAILSGLTPAQEAGVTAAYRLQGLHLERRFELEDWSTLVVRR